MKNTVAVGIWKLYREDGTFATADVRTQAEGEFLIREFRKWGFKEAKVMI